MKGIIETPAGHIRLSEIIMYGEIDSWGWRDHQQVWVKLRSGERIVTGMYMSAFRKEWERAEIGDIVDEFDSQSH